MTAPDFTDVTEMAGEEISPEQLFRLANRYYWAGDFADGKDVIEVACGTGPGLGYLAERTKSLKAGDFSEAMVDQVVAHYGDRVECMQFDAQAMPFDDNSADLILIFEALYYVPSAEAFVAECKRVLRPSGQVLVSNANPDLFDFNPSPHSFTYHGVTGLAALFGSAGFETQFWGSTPLAKVGLKQKILRPVKKFVVSSGLMPKSMAGKRLLKRLVFGEPVRMPAEVSAGMVETETPNPLPADRPDTDHKVIYCAARLPDGAA
ncbi:MAG: class I SAM-dependent methyltransferase [Roseitalea porphyridii]|jgi:SAM-dependent methyltransferase|uniref:class I SAM-dependent methyltransferase n=1 Tax=Roseitalea porphyridii TaxID=1852022 RepID=UPI0032EAF555